MGDKTSIEWTRGEDGSPGATWNPIVGCSRISEGCDHCYAIGAVARGAAMGASQHVGLTVKPEGGGLDWSGGITVVPHLLDQYWRKRRGRKIFVNSLSDLFHPDLANRKHATGRPFVAEIIARMCASPQHTYQVLTKRPQAMAAALAPGSLLRDCVDVALEDLGVDNCWSPGASRSWPDHIWWGTTIELPKYNWRANYLRLIDGTRWISAEPLLGDIAESLDLSGIDWLVGGGESGTAARPMHPQWVRNLRDLVLDQTCPECGERRPFDQTLSPCSWCNGNGNGPAFFFKQWGSWSPYYGGYPAKAQTVVVDDGNDRHCRMWRVGKQKAGRILDRRTWDEYP